MLCTCYTIVLCIVIQSGRLGVAHASVQESVSNPKVAFLLSYLEAGNLRAGTDLLGRRALLLKQGQSLFVHFCTPLASQRSFLVVGLKIQNRKSPDC